MAKSSSYVEKLFKRFEKLKNPDIRHEVSIDEILEDYDSFIDYLEFVERWVTHHGSKPNVSPEEALDFVRHYPLTREMTKTYSNGVIPKPTISQESLDAILAILKKDADAKKSL